MRTEEDVIATLDEVGVRECFTGEASMLVAVRVEANGAFRLARDSCRTPRELSVDCVAERLRRRHRLFDPVDAPITVALVVSNEVPLGDVRSPRFLSRAAYRDYFGVDICPP